MKRKQLIPLLLLIVAAILVSSCGGASANPNKAWRTYENQNYSYSFNYPPDCTFGPLPTDCKSDSPKEQRPACLCFLNAENPDRVLMQRVQKDGDQLILAEFSIAHLKTPVGNSPNEVGLSDWLAENFPEKWENAETESIKVGGKPGVSISISASEMAPAVEEIYLIHNDRLYQIRMLDADVEINNRLYERILLSFRFDG